MKILFFLFLFFQNSAFLFSQGNAEIYARECRNTEKRGVNLPSLELYTQGKLISKIDWNFRGFCEIDSLKPGDYQIEFETIFHEKRSKSFHIDSTETKIVSICVDEISYEDKKGKSFIYKLKNGANYELNIASSGCFHKTNETLVFSKSENKFYLSYKNTKTELSKEQIDAVFKFEVELQTEKDNGCTTQTMYTIKFKRKKHTYKDGSCSWNGNYHLFEALKI